MESSIAIEERATAWLGRRDGDDWSAEDETALTQWLGESTAHRVAFLRAEAAWESALRLQALNAGVPRGTVPSPDDWYQTHLREQRIAPAPEAQAPASRGRMKLYALAASVLVALGAGLVWQLRPADPSYRTPVGGTATVPLLDGSKITLNTDTHLRVQVNEEVRRVSLEQGEAFFEVARDLHRPFIVEAGGERVIAIGTKFSVRRDAAGIRVVVTEGAVRVEGPEGSSVHEPPLTAGTVAVASPAGMVRESRTAPEVGDYLSWRDGMLVFRDVTLAEAIAEFNRYNVRQIVIEDGAVAGLRVGGTFRATNVGEFLQLLEKGYPLRVAQSKDRIALLGEN